LSSLHVILLKTEGKVSRFVQIFYQEPDPCKVTIQYYKNTKVRAVVQKSKYKLFPPLWKTGSKWCLHFNADVSSLFTSTGFLEKNIYF